MPQIDPRWASQVIIVDGGSTDGTIEWAREHGYEVYVQKKKGIRHAYLEVLPLIRGEIVLTFSPDGNCSPSAIPLILEKMQEGYDLVIGSRYVSTVHLFEVVSIAGVVSAFAQAISFDRTKMAILSLLVLTIVAINQNKKSSLEVIASAMEIDAVHARLDAWLDTKGYKNSRWIVAIVPKKHRPEFVARLLAGQNVGSWATWSGDPNHYYQLITGVLRGRNDIPVGRTIPFVICNYDQTCVKKTLTTHSGGVAFSLLDQRNISNAPIKVTMKPVVINFSTMTSDPVIPTFELVK